MPDGRRSRPTDIDDRLWVVVEGVDGRCYLSGNCHTHLGRMSAWSDHLGTGLCMSKDEIRDASELATIWVDGFLHGNEPRLDVMFGIEALRDADDDDPRWTVWREATAAFRAEGTWNHSEFPIRGS